MTDDCRTSLQSLLLSFSSNIIDLYGIETKRKNPSANHMLNFHVYNLKLMICYAYVVKYYLTYAMTYSILI